MSLFTSLSSGSSGISTDSYYTITCWTIDITEQNVLKLIMIDTVKNLPRVVCGFFIHTFVTNRGDFK
ncbi:hypothetical protein BBEV_0802 [Salisediminibacterium beveridgei]|uniref:Uncharacterized protein n=1 Tax=Salisediminibacterium beveridgei TaxID=632773 RepID=A0A1D7QT27_9BACI|nr:hypothetical protein BBEV_0802 [Salisediminibacterium beveridgei]